MGELGEAVKGLVSRAAAVSAPVDLMAAGEALGRGFSLFYAKHFLATKKVRAEAKHARFPGSFDLARMRRARTLREFDDVVTAPLHGYPDTDDYWTRASSKPLLRNVAIPTLLVNAKDDPFLPAEALPAPGDVSPHGPRLAGTLVAAVPIGTTALTAADDAYRRDTGEPCRNP